MDKTAKKILFWGGLAAVAYYVLLKRKAAVNPPPSLTNDTPGAVDLDTYTDGDFNGVPGIDPSSGF